MNDTSHTNGLFTRLARCTRLLAVLMILAIAPLTVSCYGKFPLTNAVYRFNGEVSEDRVITQVLFWAFIILPVYGIAQLGDALIFNLIEFWTGEEFEVSANSEQEGIATALKVSPDGQTATLTVPSNLDGDTTIQFVKQTDGSSLVLDPKGRTIGHVVPTPQGTVLLQDAEGRTVREIQPGARGL